MMEEKNVSRIYLDPLNKVTEVEGKNKWQKTELSKNHFYRGVISVMFFYFVIILFLILFSIGKVGKIKKKTIFALAMLILYFLATVRSLEIGNDTGEYYRIFSNICGYHNIESLTGRYEIGYLWLNEVIAHFTENFWIFLAIVNAIVYYAYYLFIERYSSNPMMSVVFFFTLGVWGQTMNIIRLQLAIAMCIYAMIMKENKRWILCIAFMILAVFFQRISFVYWVAFLIPAKISKKFYISVLVGLLVEVLFLPEIMEWAARYMSYFAVYFSSSIYILDDTKLSSVLGALMRGAVFIYSIIIYLKTNSLYEEKYSESNREISIQINMVFVAMLVMIISFRFNLLDRCEYFFWIYSFVLIPNIISRLDKKRKAVAVNVVLTVAVLYFIIINVYRPNWNHIYPYSTILFN